MPRLEFDDSESDYETQIITMEIKRIRVSPIEIFKTINNGKPSYMKNKFTSKENTKTCTNGNVSRRHKTASYSKKISEVLGPKSCNKLSSNIKSETSYMRLRNTLINGSEINVILAFVG